MLGIHREAWRAIVHFRITACQRKYSPTFFSLSDTALAARGGIRQIVDEPVPCRISPTGAAPGGEVVLLNYEHHPVNMPYRSRYAIYIR